MMPAMDPVQRGAPFGMASPPCPLCPEHEGATIRLYTPAGWFCVGKDGSAVRHVVRRRRVRRRAAATGKLAVRAVRAESPRVR
jgi:hypothetical protein